MINYSCQNLLSQIKRDSEEFNYIYDGTLLKSITQKGILNQTIKIEYNSDFLAKSLEYSNKNFTIDYDSDGRVVKVGDFTIEYRGKSVITKDANYSKKIRLNGYGEVEKSKDKIFSFTLKRDGLGEIVKKVEKLNKKEIKSRYKYDLRGRLIEVKRGGKVVESYSYDTNGNRLLATIYGKTYQATYNQDDQLVKYGKFSYSYDEDGYLVSKSDGNSTTNYEYGTFGELKRVVTPTKTIEYLHNVNHQRVAKKVNGEIVEKYLWLNLTTLLAIYDKDDNLVWRFEYADSRMPMTMRDINGTKYYLHYDQVGSLRAVSNQNGELLKEIVYDTFGNIIADSNTSLKVPFGFAGGLYDSDTKLVRFGFRDYDPFTGRWTAKDPILFNGEDTNLYGYVLGDPVGLVDINGLCVSASAPAYEKIAFGVCPKFTKEEIRLAWIKGIENLKTISILGTYGGIVTGQARVVGIFFLSGYFCELALNNLKSQSNEKLYRHLYIDMAVTGTSILIDQRFPQVEFFIRLIIKKVSDH